MAMFIVNKAVFSHVHRLNDGRIIEHAHPYDSTSDSEPYKSHQHSSTEMLFFQNLEILFTIAFLTLVLIALGNKIKVSPQGLSKYRLVFLTLHKGRAPPIS